MTSLTVTVSMGGASTVGLFGNVAVLSGALIAASQTGVVNSADNSTHPPDVPITPGVTGSWVYAATDYGPNTAIGGIVAGTTVDESFSNANIAGAIYHAGPVTGGVLIQPGGTTPTCVAGLSAIAEILASSTIVLQTSPIPFLSNTATSVTSASFSPAPGTLLVVGGAGYGGGAGTDTISISDSFGLTWRQLVVRNTAGQGASSIWVADAPPSTFISAQANAMPQRRRRGKSRLWRGTTVRTTNAAAQNNPPGRVPSGSSVKIPRRLKSRAIWSGKAVQPTVTTWTVERTNLATRSSTRVTWRHTTVPTVNAQGVTGTRQPRAVIPVPRRRPARATVSSIYGSVPVIVVAQPLKAAVFRRKTARVRFKGTVVVTVNATPTISGTIQPSATFPLPRRRIARLKRRHIYGVVGIHPSGRAPGRIGIARRSHTRVTFRRVIGQFNQHGPSGRIGKLFIPRRTTERVIFRGTIVRTVNAPHPIQVRYHYVVSRRKPARAVWHRRLAPFIRSVPVTGKGWVSRRKTARVVTHRRLVAFRYGKPITGGLVRRRKTARLVTHHRYGSFRLSYVVTGGKAYRRPRHGVVFRTVRGQVPLFRVYITGGKSYVSRRPARRVLWHTSTGIVPCFTVDATLVSNWRMELNPIFFPPPHVCA